jgi:hypothetical protein
MELQVVGLGGAPPVTTLPADDFTIEVTQDGVKQRVRARMVTPGMSRTRNSDGTMSEPKPFQNVGFAVPHGLHPGEVQVVLFYRDKPANLMNLTIVDRPLRPLLPGPAVMTPAPSSVPPPTANSRTMDIGPRFERDSKVQLHLKPLPDPEDPSAGVLVRFRQNGVDYDAAARSIQQPARVEHRDRGTAFLAARNFVEVEVPAALTMGPAEMELKLRANGAESDPVLLKVQITDSARSSEAPSVNAPRLLAINPRRVGAGQALMLSVDYLRTLNPDPSQTLIWIEHDSARYMLRPEINTAIRLPDKTPDLPVGLIVRPTREIIGPAQIRVSNSLRGEQGLSPAIPIEIVDEALPPDLLSVGEPKEPELIHLRRMNEIELKAGHHVNAYDPKRRYLTIRGRDFDPNPRFVRVTIEQNGQSTALALSDLSYVSPDVLIVRLPETVTAGPLKISVANVGAQSISVAVTMNFELPERQ